MSLYKCRINPAVIAAVEIYIVAQTAMIAAKLAQEWWDRRKSYSGSVTDVMWISDLVVVESLNS